MTVTLVAAVAFVAVRHGVFSNGAEQIDEEEAQWLAHVAQVRAKKKAARRALESEKPEDQDGAGGDDGRPVDESKVARKISKIFIYPVKSLRGIEVKEAIIEERGFRHDRRWMVVDDDGTFLSQRRFPRMSLISAKVLEQDDQGNAKVLELDCDDMPFALEVPVLESSENLFHSTVRVWDDHVAGAYDQGDNAARWLKHAMRTRRNVRLVYMGPGCDRPVSEKYSVTKSDVTSFADGFPYLVISQASLNDLNTRMDKALNFDRFRPNFVITGATPYQEDEMKLIDVEDGKAQFHFVKPCARCKMTTIDQSLGVAPKSLNVPPLSTLATFRKEGDDVFMGMNLIASSESSGKVLRVGDSYRVIEDLQVESKSETSQSADEDVVAKE